MNRLPSELNRTRGSEDEDQRARHTGDQSAAGRTRYSARLTIPAETTATAIHRRRLVERSLPTSARVAAGTRGSNRTTTSATKLASPKKLRRIPQTRHTF